MQIALVGSPAEMMSPEPAPAFPFNKSFHEIADKPAFILHTSGSTGTPKPIVCRHGILAVADSYHLRPEFEGQPHILKAFADLSTRCLCASKYPF